MVVTNHHAGQGGFRGLAGVFVALSLLVGRAAAARLACELTELTPDDLVVDVGCGPGVAAREARRRGAAVTGVDPAPVMLRFARALPSAGIEYLSGTAESIPLGDGSCTVAWSLATAHHWVDVDAALASLHRVLRPGGRLVVVERSSPEGARGHASHGWTAAQTTAFAEACRRARFSSVRVIAPAGRRPVHAVVASS